jgi:DNA-binding beta-propeller fold protein YncE
LQPINRRFLGAWMAFIALVLFAPASAEAAPVPLAEVGSSGSGAGQLAGPRGLAIDGAGNIYVAEAGNSRISVFGPDGTFIHAFGWGVDTGAAAFEVCTTATTCQTGIAGGGAGQFNFPSGVALDGAGNLYVAEISNNRISVFSTAGPSFTSAFGFGVDTGASAFEVCTTASTCQAGLTGGDAGQLAGPGGVAVDSAGDIFVAEGTNNRISVFGGAGPSFTRAFGWGVDTGASAFEVCTVASTCQTGLLGAGAGQITPGGLAVDDAGSLYVTEAVNRRISIFGTAGPSFTRAFGFGVDTGASAFEVCTTASTCQGGSGGGGAAGALDFPRAAAVDGTGQLYVAEQTTSRISVFDVALPSFTRAFGFGVDTGASAFEICTIASTCQTGLAGSAAGQLDAPFGVATECPGAVWTADADNDRIDRFGELGTPPMPQCLSSPPSSPSGPGAATPAPTANPLCAQLRAKLKRLKRRLARADSVGQRATIKAKIRKIRKKLRKLGC